MTVSPHTMGVGDHNRSPMAWTDRAETVPASSGNAVELYVAELRQLFDPLDPRPCSGGRWIPGPTTSSSSEAEICRLAGHSVSSSISTAAGLVDERAVLRDAVHGHFQNCADASWRRLRELFRVGRISLLIGLAALAIAVAAGQLLERNGYDTQILVVLRDTVVIGGWVAMWRPLQIFLYDWWPIRAEARLFERLAAMPVHLRWQHSDAPFLGTGWKSCEPHRSNSK